ncbi:MAG: phosphoglycolate phosphatase [Hydrogenophaga sp.]|nr:phosphoglycolate phosphatase [Hydrogenophaga sp.]
MQQAAIIDLDGTLVDTLGDFVEALNRTLAELSLPPLGGGQVERMIGKGSENLLLSAMAHLGEPDPATRLPEAWAAYQRHYLDVNGRFSQVFPGALEGLQALRDAGLPLACLTNKPLAFARTLLRDKGLDGFFSHVFGGDSFERKKPDPLPLLKTCAALGTLPAHTLMVGDSQNDGLAARAAGCPVVLVTYGYNHGDPIADAPHDALLDSLAELAHWPGVTGRPQA